MKKTWLIIGNTVKDGERFKVYLFFRRLWIYISLDRHSFRLYYLPV